MSEFEEPVLTRYVERIQAVQAHPIPSRVSDPRGPFPEELLAEPEIIVPNTRDDYAKGATVQNNFNPPRYLICGVCRAKVLQTETDKHVCGE